MSRKYAHEVRIFTPDVRLEVQVPAGDSGTIKNLTDMRDFLDREIGKIQNSRGPS